MHDWPALAASLSATLATTVAAEPSARVHGGCINESYRWDSAAGPFFVKIAAPTGLDALEAEAAGLDELARAEAVRVPRVRGAGTTATTAYLALEWIDMVRSTGQAEGLLGEQLATQHRVLAPPVRLDARQHDRQHPQSNDASADWVEFFREASLASPARARAAQRFHRALTRARCIASRLDGRLLQQLSADAVPATR